MSSTERNMPFDEALKLYQSWLNENVSAGLDEFVSSHEFSEEVNSKLREHVEKRQPETVEGSSVEFPETKTVEPTGRSQSRKIDRYKLLQTIGEGGMGTVWMAEQTEPIRRRVALKIIRAGNSSTCLVGCPSRLFHFYVCHRS